MLATIATTNSWANLALAKRATGCHVIQPEYEMTKMMQVIKHSYIEKFVNTASVPRQNLSYVSRNATLQQTVQRCFGQANVSPLC